MSENRILIIGAGIAGLSSAAYLARNGYQVDVYEQHALPGGLCTAWKRGDYVFDWCIHWLVGTRPGAAFSRVWEELGALDGMEIRDFPEFTRIEYPDGEHFTLYSDADRLEAEMLRLGPEDRKAIRRFCNDIRKFAKFDVPVATEEWGLLDTLRFALRNTGTMLAVLRLMRTPLSAYVRRFRSKRLQDGFQVGFPPDWSVAALMMGMAMQHAKAGGYPVGGSLRFARNIEETARAAGARFHYNRKVVRILVENGRAVGIRLADGEEIRGERVVSAADAQATLFGMLDGAFLPKKWKTAFDAYPLFPSALHIGYGVARDLSDQPHSRILLLSEPLVLADGSRINQIGISFYHFDPTLAPAGKTPVTVLLPTWNDGWWRELAEKDRTAYETAKRELAERVLDLIDGPLGGIRAALEVSDVATPHTVCRYTGNWHGSYEGWAPTPRTLGRSLPRALPGLAAFRMVGQWTAPGGGLPPAGKDGRDLARRFCKEDKRALRSSR